MHAIIYTDSISSTVGVFGENPIVRLVFLGEVGAVYDMDLQTFMAAMMGVATVGLAIAFFVCLLSVQMHGFPRPTKPMFSLIVVATFGYLGALTLEYVLLSERLALLANEAAFQDSILEGLGLEPDPSSVSQDRDWLSAAFIILLILVNAIAAWFTASGILERYNFKQDR